MCHELFCPMCLHGQDLIVVCQTEVLLTSDGTDRDFNGLDHSEVWDDASPIRCDLCDWNGVIAMARQAYLMQHLSVGDVVEFISFTGGLPSFGCVVNIRNDNQCMIREVSAHRTELDWYPVVDEFISRPFTAWRHTAHLTANKGARIARPYEGVKFRRDDITSQRMVG